MTQWLSMPEVLRGATGGLKDKGTLSLRVGVWARTFQLNTRKTFSATKIWPKNIQKMSCAPTAQEMFKADATLWACHTVSWGKGNLDSLAVLGTGLILGQRPMPGYLVHKRLTHRGLFLQLQGTAGCVAEVRLAHSLNFSRKDGLTDLYRLS